MRITLPSDQPEVGEVTVTQENLTELLTDPVWQALQGGLTQIGPRIGEEEIRSLVGRLHEHKMMDQLQDLLHHLPQESQQLLDRLQDGQIQSA